MRARLSHPQVLPEQQTSPDACRGRAQPLHGGDAHMRGLEWPAAPAHALVCTVYDACEATAQASSTRRRRPHEGRARVRRGPGRIQAEGVYLFTYCVRSSTKDNDMRHGTAHSRGRAWAGLPHGPFMNTGAAYCGS